MEKWTLQIRSACCSWSHWPQNLDSWQNTLWCYKQKWSCFCVVVFFAGEGGGPWPVWSFGQPHAPIPTEMHVVKSCIVEISSKFWCKTVNCIQFWFNQHSWIHWWFFIYLIKTWQKRVFHHHLTLHDSCEIRSCSDLSKRPNIHQVWPKTSCKAQWKGEEDKADRGRGGKTTSGNGQAWSLASPKGQWRTGKKLRKLVAKSPVVPQRPSWLRDWWWWWNSPKHNKM